MCAETVEAWVARAKRRARRVRCPRCNAADPLPIVFGYPEAELGEAAERGEIVLGGCVIEEVTPEWHCSRCSLEW